MLLSIGPGCSQWQRNRHSGRISSSAALRESCRRGQLVLPALSAERAPGNRPGIALLAAIMEQLLLQSTAILEEEDPRFSEQAC